MRLQRLVPLACAIFLSLPTSAQPQGMLPEPLGRGEAIELNVALNQAFNDDLEDICRCRDVAGATRFERFVEELKELERALEPEAVREALLAEGVDIPIEQGDTPRSYLERAERQWSLTARPLRGRLRALRSDAENLERLRANRWNPYHDVQPPPGVEREMEILRALREAFADCHEDDEVPPPPEDHLDARVGLVIDPPGDAPVHPPTTPAALRDALRNELRNLCCKRHGDQAFGAWIGSATLGIDSAPPDVQDNARAHRDLLWDLATTMDSRGFHDWVEVEFGYVRKRCTDEILDSSRVGLIDLEEGRVSSVIDPPRGEQVRSIADEIAEGAADDLDDAAAEAEPAPRDPPAGFRHVTRGSNPSRHTPESNHVAEGPDASARVRDFFEEGREVPHVEDGVFTDRHVTDGEHASQYVDPELHVAEGPEASSLRGDPLTPPGGERHLTRGPGATSYVPEDRHVTVGPEASGLKRGGGGAAETDRGEEEGEVDEEHEEDGGDEESGEDDEDDEDDEDEDSEEDAGGELASSPEDHNPDEVDDAPPARGVQRMIVEVDGAGVGEGQTGPGGSVPFPAAEGATPDVYLVSLGTSTGRAFVVHAVGESADLSGVVVVEPVAVPERARRRIDERLRTAGVDGTPADGYCLEFERLVPPAGTLFRLSSRAVQVEHAPVRRILAASRRLRDAGALAPDTDPERYFHAIRQWAIWTREKEFDELAFTTAFLERTRKNFRAAGQAWNDEIEAAVRSLVPNRWRDVQAVLRQAGE